jgi:anti-anti-sigma regulatory factor
MEYIAETQLDTLPPEASWIRVGVVRGDDDVVLTVSGEADAFTATQLRADLMSALPDSSAPVVLDVAEVTFCDLAGIYALRDFVGAALLEGSRVDLRGMSRLMTWMYETLDAPSMFASTPNRW